jgi:hypothetical protein
MMKLQYKGPGNHKRELDRAAEGVNHDVTVLADIFDWDRAILQLDDKALDSLSFSVDKGDTWTTWDHAREAMWNLYGLPRNNQEPSAPEPLAGPDDATE